MEKIEAEVRAQEEFKALKMEHERFIGMSREYVVKADPVPHYLKRVIEFLFCLWLFLAFQLASAIYSSQSNNQVHPVIKYIHTVFFYILIIHMQISIDQSKSRIFSLNT
ncbi:hypothetical protein H4Q26_011610 [Puccinia striiformis f. sp. tritici PST-130]|nr:hypothetical protein H4Q26_011610 [Puccinia striiformis f. sp. tritici PST-130]